MRKLEFCNGERNEFLLSFISDSSKRTNSLDTDSVVVKELRLKDKDKDKDLMSKDKDLKIGP